MSSSVGPRSPSFLPSPQCTHANQYEHTQTGRTISLVRIPAGACLTECP